MTRQRFQMMPAEIVSATADLSKFPTTRYQGSKRKVIPWIYEHLRKLEFGSALDLFGGTGTVSYLLKRMGKQVSYNDKLRFNYLIGSALIENDEFTLTGEEIDALLAPSTVKKSSVGIVTGTFQDIFFTDEENQQIDEICNRIAFLEDGSEKGRFKAALASNALFQSCLIKRPFNLFHRKNLYLRFARVERSFGNKITWDTPLNVHFKNFAMEANGFVFKGKKRCRALNSDALKISAAQFDLVYIDPPYLSKHGSETADYQKCYHFLEGLSRYSSWHGMIDFSTKNRRFRADTDNPWISESANTKAFDELFEKFEKSILIISYKKFGVPSLTTLVRLLKRHGRKTSVHTRHYIYALNHQNGNAALNREALIVAI